MYYNAKSHFGLPFSLGVISIQFPTSVPKATTNNDTANPYSAVKRNEPGVSLIKNIEIAYIHIRSP